MTHHSEISEPIHEFVDGWVKTLFEHPDIPLGEWLYALGAICGLALRSQDLAPEELRAAIAYINESLLHVYKDAEQSAQINTTLQ